MIISSIILSGLELGDGKDYWFHFSGHWDFEKDVITNDIFSDGQDFGRSKSKPKTLTLTGYVLGGEDKQLSLNRVLAPNGLKTLIINHQFTAQVEMTSRGSSTDDSRIVTLGFTMPDPRWYALAPATLSLDPQLDGGVIFGTATRISLDAGSSAAAARTGLDAGSSTAADRTELNAGGSD